MVRVTASRRLRPAELVRRARRLKLVLADCDGVLTDACVEYTARGETARRFNLRDGMGVERLRMAGIETAILTRERARAIAHRAAKLAMPHLFLGVRDKVAELPTILERCGVAAAATAFIGDDVNDLGLLERIGGEGLTGAPGDAMREVRDSVHHRCRLGGGQGAFREFAEWILALRADGERPRTSGRGRSKP